MLWTDGYISPRGVQERVPNLGPEHEDGTGSVLTVTNSDPTSRKVSNLDTFSVGSTVRTLEPSGAW
jgi:hypothetical protein